MKIVKHQLVKTPWKPGLSHGQPPKRKAVAKMLSSIQFSKFKKPTNNGPKPPKVKNGGSYKYPKPVPTREERDLMESKARINNAKAAKLNREA